MVVACHCEGTGWRFYGDSNLRSKFWGRSIQLDPEGILTLEFDDGEIFQWSKVYYLKELKNLPPSLISSSSEKHGPWCFAGNNIYIQPYSGKTILRSLWFNADTRKP